MNYGCLTKGDARDLAKGEKENGEVIMEKVVEREKATIVSMGGNSNSNSYDILDYKNTKQLNMVWDDTRCFSDHR